MTLTEAIKESQKSDYKLKIRRSSWTHGDRLILHNTNGYNGGELWYDLGDHHADLFYIGDIIANDWTCE